MFVVDLSVVIESLIEALRDRIQLIGDGLEAYIDARRQACFEVIESSIDCLESPIDRFKSAVDRVKPFS